MTTGNISGFIPVEIIDEAQGFYNVTSKSKNKVRCVSANGATEQYPPFYDQT